MNSGLSRCLIIYGSARKILVLIASQSSERTGESAHMLEPLLLVYTKYGYRWRQRPKFRILGPLDKSAWEFDSACWVIFHALVVICRLFSKFTFSRSSFRNTTRVSNGLDPDQDRHCVGLDLGPNCLQGYQQTTKVAASKVRVLYNRYQNLLYCPI